MNKEALNPTKRDAVINSLSWIAELPVHLLARLKGESAKAFLAGATGVSLARISEGKLSAIQESTIVRGQKKLISTFKTKALQQGYSSEDFDRLVTVPTRTSTGSVSLWVAFIESLDPWQRWELTLTRHTALALDELLVGLILATKSVDFQKFKDSLKVFCSVIATTPTTSNPDLSRLNLWAASRASDWDEAFAHVNLAFDELFLEIFAALDAECSSQYFPAMEPRPLLLALATRINPDWNIDNAAHLKRNRIFRPSRRLLEMLHSVMYCHLHGCWPEALPGRKDIADACGWSEMAIGNFFDGTKKLTLANCEVIWDQSFKIARGSRTEPPLFPRHLAFIALSLEKLLVRQTKQYKLKELILLDEAFYSSRWESHRQKLPTPDRTGVGKWPDWLTNQPLSSEFVRSSQSSGRSSSPRECQYSS